MYALNSQISYSCKAHIADDCTSFLFFAATDLIVLSY